jgi:hypothetical protein
LQANYISTYVLKATKSKADKWKKLAGDEERRQKVIDFFEKKEVSMIVFDYDAKGQVSRALLTFCKPRLTLPERGLSVSHSPCQVSAGRDKMVVLDTVVMLLVVVVGSFPISRVVGTSAMGLVGSSLIFKPTHPASKWKATWDSKLDGSWVCVLERQWYVAHQSSLTSAATG